jgi:opacity protein-like surface antigen
MIGSATSKSVLATVVFLAVSSAAPAHAQAPPPEDPFRRGNTELGLLVGFGYALDIWGGLPDSEFLALGLRLGRVITPPIAPGPLRGSLVISTELYPAIAFHEPQRTSYAFSGTLIFRYHFAPGSRARPFISFGSGIVGSTQRIPHDLSRLNFTTQGGPGLAIRLNSGAVMSIEYRIHHMSNGVVTDYNPGANSNAFAVGLTWVRGSPRYGRAPS